ncbi:hypothetical protein PISMIDRAFT_115941 [Pisolithus microcarpus 441]|uniref:Protein kinase domain-containing protein n=1 Tax=Pisolithus microcarpus 441 TaxID=765257 RepID=A0A0C9Z4Y0_9AGAM|nr:hypothetical protein PISMIDRAFT_115941 [Pisolithus microcarpus 441]
MQNSPSGVTKSKNYMNIQGGDTRILDCRCVAGGPATVGPPIQLFNPAFAYFTSKAFDPEHDVPRTFVRQVRQAIESFALIHPPELARRRSLTPILQELIGLPIIVATNIDGTPLDGVVLGSLGQTECTYLAVVVYEAKNEFGDGASDPSAQGAFSYLRIFCQDNNRNIRLRTCCPAFIIAHAGPWLTILGGIITSKCVVQRLTDCVWVPIHSTHDDDHYLRIARIFYVLRESIELLQLSYERKMEPYNPLCYAPHPRFFPSIHVFSEGGVQVEFEYEDPLERDDTCVTYRAKTVGTCPENIVVKFVTRYGVDAHQTMADAGFAPKLRYFGSIGTGANATWYGKLKMVVMDYVEGLTLSDALERGEVPADFPTRLREAIAFLHGAGFVFGDLREPNIMLTPGDKVVQLIDFDWAGKDGEAVYPLSLSSHIQWPIGVAGLKRIKKEHDLSNLVRILTRFETDTGMEICV